MNFKQALWPSVKLAQFRQQHSTSSFLKGFIMQPVRNILTAVCLSLALAAAFVFGIREYSRMPESKTTFVSTGPTIQQLEELAELVSLQVTTNDIMSAESEGFFGYKGSWIIKGEALYATDLALAEIAESSGPGTESKWRISLPAPVIKWARIDHENSKVYDVSRKHWLPWDSATANNMRDQAMLHGQQKVLQSAMKPEYAQRAKARTEQTIKSFYGSKGTIVEIVWRDHGSSSSPQLAQR